ncbi:6-carboxytetrahydropterin synthase QueD [Desulforhopalus singaporensis]|uniref:6-carboxy-5,6,7,8-tetrahydropterin synthase n=1 Tax=Desulforhopalus singaporensis TaxID=91360 RepID=A0A1H0PJ70_9BACT|nr:6-carboxytetrahydropterin synthase QueD [Desulforhopalus singaporensis]SDP05107.1 6-pyruvoyltetrahydropterin/6-carboxytetrahydropterin synthase [Desulforhopalus singaporensis]
MYDIFIDTHFAGAHHLRDYPGDCEKPHGHNWKVRVTVRAAKVDKCGMGMDFTLLKKVVKEVIDLLDHHDLNTLPYFQEKNPSSEYIAEFIYGEVRARLTDDNHRIFSVRVLETDTQGLIYYGPEGPKF